jgi:tetratricopeptide (TPR) repeat protein
MENMLIQEIYDCINQEDFSTALQKAQQYLSANPQRADAYIAYGDVFFDMENGSKAIENYEKALELDAGNAELFFKLGRAYELKENYQVALSHYQTAKRINLSNKLYSGYAGRLLAQKGYETNNANFIHDGITLMEQTLEAGAADAYVKEDLAIATEYAHVLYTRQQIEKAKPLNVINNRTIDDRIADLEQQLAELEQKKFQGYNYILKAPIVLGILTLLVGLWPLTLLLFLMAGLYYYSQVRPLFVANKMILKNARDPFVIRRMRAMSEELSSITFYGSLTNVLFMKYVFQLFFTLSSYCLVVMFLPYEIIKGLIFNQQTMKNA